jgi:serine/threonine-protein kinase
MAFGTYRVLHQTGSGVLGPVFRAFDTKRDRLVAVKAFTLDLLPEKVARLADALRRLASAPPVHPAVVSFIEVGLEGMTPFAVMEHQPGETLDVVLRRIAPTTIEEALPVLSQLADAVDAASLVGVGHGALHPRDVFVAPGDHGVSVTGFGIVQALESIGLAAPLLRRPYVAPERANAKWDLRADVFSLGALAHELFTGRRPAGSGEQDGVFDHELPPQQRVQLRRVLAMALAERPEHRYANGATFIGALEAAARRRSVPVGPVNIEQSDRSMLSVETFDAAVPLAVIEAVVAESPGPSPAAAPVPSSSLMLKTEDVPTPVADTVVRAPLMEASVQAPIAVGAETPGLSHRVLAAGDEIDLFSTEEDVALPVVESPSATERRGMVWLTAAMFAAGGLLIGISGVYLFARYRQTAATAPPVVAAAPAAQSQASPATAVHAERPPVIEPVEDTPEPAAAAPASDVRRAAAPAGRLLIRSEPAGALVFIDGRVSGETPVTVRDVSLGSHAVRVARSGYVPQTERVTLQAESPARTMSFKLEAGLPQTAAVVGAVDVDSRPRGARVFVDGRLVGQAPLRIAELRPGEHRVTIELGGYYPVTNTVEVVAGKSSVLRLTLQSIH